MNEVPEFPLRRKNELGYVSASVLEDRDCLRHFFFCRVGGFSSGAHESLNFSFSTDDDRKNVERNRAKTGEVFGLPRPIVFAKQVHGDNIALIDEGNLERMYSEPPEADALVTKLRNVPLAVLTADCMPAIICDAGTPALAVVHAGWKGTALSVIWKTILYMIEQFGSKAEDCYAAIGPGISGTCYEVGGQVRDAFLQGLPFGESVLSPAGPSHWRADLKDASYRQLLDGAIPPGQAAVCPYCTHCEMELFFSARRDRDGTGRQPAVAFLV